MSPMPGFLRAIVRIPHLSGLPKDDIINTWAFQSTVDPFDSTARAAATIAISSDLNTFYNAIKANLSAQYQWNVGTISYLDLSEPKPRLPYEVDPLVVTGLTGALSDMPPEVSVCLSFKGSTVSGQNARRRRGRVYLGPLQITSSTDVAAVPPAVVTSIVNAAVALRSSSGPDWCVYSRYEHYGVPVGRNIGETVPGTDPPEFVFEEDYDRLLDAFTPVTTVWVDNAWDTQRRRGIAATSRTTG